MTQASDVIGNGVRKAKTPWERDVKDDPSLKAITYKIRALANSCGQLGVPLVARELEEIAHYLAKRCDHADPCDDEACPCRKAEADEWRFHGAVRH